jgi:pyridoxamine 5'-phosphate oxidase
MSHQISHIRRDYMLQKLDEKDLSADPIVQFGAWWDEAIKSEIHDINAMTLATATNDGSPSARIVLLKGYDSNGFVFFTNYESEKGKELEMNPQAALCFYWKELERQIRIEGRVSKISTEDSDVYFQSRPLSSRIGAWASPQSSVIENRQVIEQKLMEYENTFGTDFVPRPSHWGGYIVKPFMIEFWQGRSSRLHDRIRYSLQNSQSWVMERLAP